MASRQRPRCATLMPNSTWALASRLASANDGEADARTAAATIAARRTRMEFSLTMPPALRRCKAFGSSNLTETSKPYATPHFGKRATFVRLRRGGLTKSGQCCPRAAIIKDGRSGSARLLARRLRPPSLFLRRSRSRSQTVRPTRGGVSMTDLHNLVALSLLPSWSWLHAAGRLRAGDTAAAALQHLLERHWRDDASK